MSKENVIEIGDRVFVNHTSGFSKGSHGVVDSITYDNHQLRYWVRRDGSGSPMWFFFEELDKLVDNTQEETVEVSEDFIKGVIDAFNNQNPAVQAVAVTALNGLLKNKT